VLPGAGDLRRLMDGAVTMTVRTQPAAHAQATAVERELLASAVRLTGALACRERGLKP
jgi:hypothetical protein